MCLGRGGGKRLPIEKTKHKATAKRREKYRGKSNGRKGVVGDRIMGVMRMRKRTSNVRGIYKEGAVETL